MDDTKIKEIINYNKSDFMDFLQNDNEGKILKVFNETGISCLKNYEYTEERIRYILVYSKYKNQLLLNKNFLDILLNSNISNYYACLNNLENNTYDFMIKRCIELNIPNSEIAELITYFNREYQYYLIDNSDIPSELIYELLKNGADILGPKILNKYDIDLLSHNINLESVVEAGKYLTFQSVKDRYFPNQSKNLETFYLSEKHLNRTLAKTIWEKFDVFRYRKFINTADYCGDTTILNNYAKEKENDAIYSNELIEPFKSLYNIAFKLISSEEHSDEWYDLRKELIKLTKNLDDKIYQDIRLLIENKDIENLKIYITNEVDKIKSNYIVDYHFEENYYNIMYDIRELLNFYYAGNINLSEEKLELYQKVSEIDRLSNEEKIELHELLKKYNIIEMFYDDMTLARKIVHQAIKDYAMTKEEINQYKNEELSKKYGVDVYTIEDNPFFAIVKYGLHDTDTLPTGHSYSLVGNGCIATFGDIKDSNTFLYDSDSLNSDQIVHTFPTDSYTLYKPFESMSESTTRVHTLMMPDEMLYNNHTYNELLILEQGTKSLKIDKNLPKLKKIALYCIDEISKEDVKTAKINNVGIFLVSSKNYNKGEEMTSSVYRHKNQNMSDYFNYNYFNGTFEKEYHEKHR